MKYISLFSGIEAATVAWEPLGWEPLAFCEIDEFPSAVLAYRYPSVPNLGDITQINWKDVIERHGRPDVVVGGSPCQSFSVAGGRASLDGESRLMFEYIRALAEIRPKWFLWENVPGVLNTRDDAFAQLLGEVQDIGYLSLAWRVLDAQFFGVAQRRRRVFLVGHLGSGGGAAAVLFESESVRGNTQTSRQKREELARAAGRGAKACGGERVLSDGIAFKYSAGAAARSMPTYSDGSVNTLTADYHAPAVATAIRTANSGANGSGVSDECAHTIDCAQPEAVAFAQSIDYKQTPKVNDEISHTLTHDGDGGIHSAVAFAQNNRNEVRLQSGDSSVTGPVAANDSAKGQGVPFVAQPMNTQNAAIDENLSDTLKVGGYSDCSVCSSNGSDIVGALCAGDGTKGVGSQYVNQGKIICQRAKS